MTDSQWLRVRDGHQFTSLSKTRRARTASCLVTVITLHSLRTRPWDADGTSSPAMSPAFLKWLLGESWPSMAPDTLVLISPHLYSGELASV